MTSAPNDALTLAHCAGALVHASHEYELGIAAARRAVELNPNNLRVVDFAGIVYLHCGDLADALTCFHRALRLSPADIDARFALTGIAHVRMIQGDYSDALVHAERSLTCNPNFDATYWMLIAANAQLGRMEEARRWLVKYCALSPGVTIARIWAGQPQKDASRCANILEGLKLAGLPEE